MKLEDRMRLSIRRRTGQVMLRAELAGLGSASQVSCALKALQCDGELIRLGSGVYAKARRDPETGEVRPLADVETLAREVAGKLKFAVDPKIVVSPGHALVLDTGNRRVSRKLAVCGHDVTYVNDRTRPIETRNGARLDIPTRGVAKFVHSLARKYRVRYTRTQTDQWAETVTRLAGDEVRSGPVQDLLIALKRAGKLSTDDMTALLVNYLRESRQGVRSV
ncbi:hypothetical protein [Burkholderia sp. AU6039]|uniref:hypothetical protein n=1 Tax=Burkholderia sp. AU6039 TaxID=2015344 RepID=UPI000B7ACF40|nr:hypothetical protein [Burkholderia sp. AU6039]OXJ06547.1 hypothetical protein CFB39_38935 [Burkholderia sp. AU6039]